MHLSSEIAAYHKNKNHIELINQSSTTLRDLKLRLHLPKPLEYLEVVRERGSLIFTEPSQLIDLGNLCPHECAHLYYTLAQIKKEKTSSQDEKVLSLMSLYLHLTQEDGLRIGKLILVS